MYKKRVILLFLVGLIFICNSNLSYANKIRFSPPISKEFALAVPQKSNQFQLSQELQKPSIRTKIEPILDFLRVESLIDELPEEYDMWSDDQINPYKVDLINMKDSILLDLSGFTKPIAINKVTSDFGLRRGGKHYGIDLKLNKGDSVYSAFNGIVRITKRVRGYGNMVLIKHFNGIETLYAHLSKISVKAGDTLNSGELLGLGGSTGRSTGNHLHFEVRYLGNVINPNSIIDFSNYEIRNSLYYICQTTFEYKKEFDKIRYWRIRSGDTLGRISMKTGVSISKLCSLNRISRSTILRIGRNIRYN